MEFNARTSAEHCNKREKINYKLEDGNYRSSMMWYCRLFAIMMCQHLDAWALPKTSPLRDFFEQAACRKAQDSERLLYVKPPVKQVAQ